MAKLTIGRRLLGALPASVALALLFYIIGAIAAEVVPVFPPLFPEACGALGFTFGVSDQLVQDMWAKAAEE